jgi:hypothetical protein
MEPSIEQLLLMPASGLITSLTLDVDLLNQWESRSAQRCSMWQLEAEQSSSPLPRLSDRKGSSLESIFLTRWSSALERKIARQQLSNARALLMDVNRMAFRDRSFDYLLCSFALDSLSDQNRALLEFRRLVRWDGQISLAISSSWWWEEDERWEWFAQLLDSLEITVRSGPRPLGTLEEVEAALENAGLVGVSATEETFDLALADEEEWWKWGWSHGWRRVLEAVDDAKLERYRSACIEQLHSSSSPGIEGRIKTIVAFARRPRR